MKVEDIQFTNMDKLIVGPDAKYPNAIVFFGAGGDISEWMEGVYSMLDHEGIMTPLDEWYLMTTTEGRKDLVMPLPPLEDVHLGRLAAWKMKALPCSWWTDYRQNNYKLHGAEAPLYEHEDDPDEYDEYEEEVWADI